MSEHPTYLENEMYEVSGELHDLAENMANVAHRMSRLQDSFFLYLDRLEDERNDARTDS